MMNPNLINPFNAVNRGVYIADNLSFLRHINTASVDLVCIDPPFAKNDTFTADKLKPPIEKAELSNEKRLLKDWSITSSKQADDAGVAWPDDDKARGGYKDTWSWDNDVHPDWLVGIEDTHPAVSKLIDATRHIHGDSIAAYLAFMAIRLFEIHRVLKPTGSLYLHCDHTASGYLRQLLDGVFGVDNFRNEIIWCYSSQSQAARWYPKKHDTIYWYAKGGEWCFNPDDIRIPYSKPLARHGKTWKSGDDAERAERTAKGKIPEDWWDIPMLNSMAKERTGYPTQKPVALAERIIKAATKPGDVVLDCFAGCAYSALAAEKLGRNWTACDINIRAWTVFKRQFNKPELILLTCNDKTTGQQVQSTIPEVTVHGHNQLPKRLDRNEVEIKPLRTDNRRQLTGPKKERDELDALLTRDEMITALLRFSHGRAWCCGFTSFNDNGTIAYGDYELDHIVPQSLGGPDDIVNRAPLCKTHNNLKRDKQIDLKDLRMEVAERKELKPGMTRATLPNLDQAQNFAIQIRQEAYQRKHGPALF